MVNAVVHLILCTITHTLVPPSVPESDPFYRVLHDYGKVCPVLKDEKLCKIFLDLDLAILGLPSTDEYQTQYSSLIAREYSHYSSTEYRDGRISVLKNFRSRKRIYYTDYFYNKFEKQARRNIKWEIETLTDDRHGEI
jgi:predicted metal-dependent HD superfamily phosphohydrolase